MLCRLFSRVGYDGRPISRGRLSLRSIITGVVPVIDSGIALEAVKSVTPAVGSYLLRQKTMYALENQLRCIGPAQDQAFLQLTAFDVIGGCGDHDFEVFAHVGMLTTISMPTPRKRNQTQGR